jgi:hypothetical protein
MIALDLGLVVWALLALATAAGMLAEWISRRAR